MSLRALRASCQMKTATASATLRALVATGLVLQESRGFRRSSQSQCGVESELGRADLDWGPGPALSEGADPGAVG